MNTEIYPIIFQRRTLLLVRKNGIWVLPGGLLNPGEDDFGSLERTVKKELSMSTFGTPRIYEGFDITPSSEARAYFVDTLGEPKLSSEIEKYAWILSRNKPKISGISLEIVQALEEDKFLV
jgi:hypothetical protein